MLEELSYNQLQNRIDYSFLKSPLIDFSQLEDSVDNSLDFSKVYDVNSDIEYFKAENDIYRVKKLTELKNKNYYWYNIDTLKGLNFDELKKIYKALKSKGWS